MAVYFVFVDGVGVADPGPANPFTDLPLRFLRHITGHAHLTTQHPALPLIDACLGHPGLPQSGTGQATLFTGEDQIAVVGAHFGPFPHSKTRTALAERSLFSQWQALGGVPCFLNAYPARFFAAAEARNRWSCTTWMSKGAGVRLHTVDDVRAGTAVTAEIRQEVWREVFHADIPVISEAEAGTRMLAAGSRADLVLFEYYLTDKAGHSQDAAQARAVLERLDAFLIAVVEGMDPARDLLVLTSDHGNLEDLAVKTHTRNPVPLLVYGRAAERFRGAETLADVTPLICRWRAEYGSGFPPPYPSR